MSKAPRQEHVDYLIETIRKDADPTISKWGQPIADVYKWLQDDCLDQREAGYFMDVVWRIVYEETTNKHHADKLFRAARDYVLDPKLKVRSAV